MSAVVAACDTVEPEIEGPPTLVIERAAEYADVFADVNVGEILVARLDGTFRDSLFAVSPGATDLRVALRPGEGEDGTEIAVVLGYPPWRVPDAFPLFAGTLTVDGTNRSGPLEVRLRVHPVAYLELGVTDTLVAAGQPLQLGHLTPLVFLDGRTHVSTEILWSSTDTSIIRVTGDIATGLRPGTAHVVGLFQDQSDSMRVEVDPAGTIVITPVTLVTHYVAADETVTDTLVARNGRVGDFGALELSIAPEFPWLAAELAGPFVVVRITGSLLPPSGGVGEIIVGSSKAGVTDVVVPVRAFNEGSAGYEARTWTPICTFGGTRRGSIPGTVACGGVRARAWNDGNVKRVLVEVENHLGSLPDSLSNGDEFILRGWGLRHSGIPGGELIRVHARGPVGRVGTPKLDPHIGSGYLEVFGEFSGMEGAVVGCSAFGWPAPRYSTCDPLGQTGYVRAEFAVPSTSWSLDAAEPVLNVTFPGLYGKCGWPGSDCFVVE